MDIREAISKIVGVSGNYAIAAKAPFTWGSEAVLFELLPPSFSVPPDVIAAGHEGLLDREEIVLLLEGIKNQQLSDKAVAEYVIHYAIYDDWPAWIADIPEKSS